MKTDMMYTATCQIYKYVLFFFFSMCTSNTICDTLKIIINTILQNFQLLNYLHRVEIRNNHLATRTTIFCTSYLFLVPFLFEYTYAICTMAEPALSLSYHTFSSHLQIQHHTKTACLTIQAHFTP